MLLAIRYFEVVAAGKSPSAKIGLHCELRNIAPRSARLSQAGHYEHLEYMRMNGRLADTFVSTSHVTLATPFIGFNS